MSKSNGGQAFPFGTEFSGMTLRDYFAAKAMQGIISNPDDDWGDVKEVCELAYGYADAMLKARKQK